MSTEIATGQASNSELNGGDQKNKLSLWLVDDDVESRQLCANILRTDGGFECPRQFGSAEAVIATLSMSPGPALLLLEARLPGMNGATAVKQIHSLSPGTRVFLFSTFFEAERAAEARAGGASGYFRKCDFAQVLQSMRPSPGSAVPSANALAEYQSDSIRS